VSEFARDRRTRGDAFLLEYNTEVSVEDGEDDMLLYVAIGLE
jgi:hypothetical protein